jgi:hypothetical protein
LRITSVRPTTVGERIRLILSRFLFELVRWQYWRFPAVRLAAAATALGSRLPVRIPDAARDAHALPFPVRTGACGASRGADERCRGVALAAWDRRFVGWFALGYVTIQLVRRLGMSLPAAEILAYTLGLALLLIALRIIWRPDSSPAGRAVGSVLAVLIWIAWVAGAQYVLWTLIVVASLPVALRVTHRAVTHFVPSSGVPGNAGRGDACLGIGSGRRSRIF